MLRAEVSRFTGPIIGCSKPPVPLTSPNCFLHPTPHLSRTPFSSSSSMFSLATTCPHAGGRCEGSGGSRRCPPVLAAGGGSRPRRGRAERSAAQRPSPQPRAPGSAPGSGYSKTTPSQHPYLHTNNWSACVYVTIQEACQGRL